MGGRHGPPKATPLRPPTPADLNEDTRISWKYGASHRRLLSWALFSRTRTPRPPPPPLAGCARYTTGTPNYAVNGLPVDAGGFTLAQWEALLDPLFQPTPASAKARAAQRALHRTGGHS